MKEIKKGYFHSFDADIGVFGADIGVLDDTIRFFDADIGVFGADAPPYAQV